MDKGCAFGAKGVIHDFAPRIGHQSGYVLVKQTARKSSKRKPCTCQTPEFQTSYEQHPYKSSGIQGVLQKRASLSQSITKWLYEYNSAVQLPSTL